MELANEAIAKAPEPKKMFEHFGFTTGLRISGRAGLTHEAQLQALQPYLEFLSDHDIFDLWEACNKREFKRFRRTHLDPLLGAPGSTMTSRLRVRPPFDMSHLDKALEGKHSPAHFWLEYAQGDGGERNELFAALLGWAQERASLAALDIAGNIYSNEATRSEFQAFQQITAQFPQAENVEKRVRFDVFHRSLT